MDIQTASPSALFRHVFGLKPGQKLSEFITEIGPLREDKVFIEEVRAYAVANPS